MTADHRGNVSTKCANQGVRFYPITAKQKVSNEQMLSLPYHLKKTVCS